MEKISIIIPAYNEENRIGKTLRTYYTFFAALKEQGIVDFELLVVLNGCRDNTFGVVQEMQEETGPELRMMDIAKAGKGLAIIAGFARALEGDADYIGFVDADMATEPQYFFDLYEKMEKLDGVIASRYMQGAIIDAPRPWVKEWGRKLIYNNMIRLLFNIRYVDYQCGAKLFKREVIASILPAMQEGQWAFDVELLYLAKKHGYVVGEIPTVWYDKVGSKLDIMGSGMRMLKALWQLKKIHRQR